MAGKQSLHNSNAELAYVAGLQEILVDLSQRLIASSSDALDNALNEALARVGAYCEADRSYLFHVDLDAGLMDETHEWCKPGLPSEQAAYQRVPLTAIPRHLALLKRRQVMHIPRVAALGADWAEEKALFEASGIESLVAVPLYTGEQLYGFIGFEVLHRPREWAPGEIQLLQGLANIIAAAIEREHAAHELRESEALRANAEKLAGMGSWEWDATTQRFFASEEWARLNGCAGQELMLDELMQLTHPDDHELVAETLAHAIEQKLPYDLEHRIIRADNQEQRWVRAYARPVLDEAGRVVRIRGFSQDITDQKASREQVDRLARRLTTTLESITDAFYTLDRQWRFTYLNHRAEEVLQANREELLGKVIWEAFGAPRGGELEQKYQEAVAHNRSMEFEYYYAPLETWFEVNAYPSEEGLAVYFRDITARKRAEDEIEFLALYDPVTRLPNRRLLMDRLTQALANCRRTGRHAAYLFLDLDNFKSLNDTLGHDVGDQLLRMVAIRLGKSLRGNDTVARFGGDEFVVLLTGLDSDAELAVDEARYATGKILAALAEPYSLDQWERHITVSIGLTLLDGQGGQPDEVMKRADLAMYKAKGEGGNQFRLFEPSMKAAVDDRVDMEVALREALQQSQIVPFYQPQVDEQGALIGLEALARWDHPERGLLLPGAFIPVAEDAGLIQPLGAAILRQVCEQLVVWAGSSKVAGLKVAVNVSARQFHHPEFVDQVFAVLDETGADGHRLQLELTESLLLSDIADTAEKMGRLKSRGISFSLDDFGTGYSSLVYLKNLPLDRLKIDRSFVRDMAVDANDAAIVHAIIALAQALSLEVVAEGVESEEIRQRLVDLGCRLFQGYLFSRPVAVADLGL